MTYAVSWRRCTRSHSAAKSSSPTAQFLSDLSGFNIRSQLPLVSLITLAGYDWSCTERLIWGVSESAGTLPLIKEIKVNLQNDKLSPKMRLNKQTNQKKITHRKKKPFARRKSWCILLLKRKNCPIFDNEMVQPVLNGYGTVLRTYFWFVLNVNLFWTQIHVCFHRVCIQTVIHVAAQPITATAYWLACSFSALFISFFCIQYNLDFQLIWNVYWYQSSSNYVNRVLFLKPLF